MYFAVLLSLLLSVSWRVIEITTHVNTSCIATSYIPLAYNLDLFHASIVNALPPEQVHSLSTPVSNGRGGLINRKHIDFGQIDVWRSRSCPHNLLSDVLRG